MKHDFESKLDLLLTEDRIAFSDSKEEAKRKVLGRIEEGGRVVSINRNQNLYRVFAAAAAVAILAVLSISFIGDQTIVADSAGMAVTLPDGSTVQLDGESSLSYNKFTWGFSRSLDLDGAAFFEVEEGSRFTVKTDNGEVAVLGTSFSVITEGETLNVACKTGKVLVSNDSGYSSTLTPGKAVEMSASKMEESTRAPRYIGTWLKGTYRFDDVSVSEVFTAIEDASTYHFEVLTETEMNYSGEFSTSQSIEEILDIVCKPLGLVYDINEEERIIRITKS